MVTPATETPTISPVSNTLAEEAAATLATERDAVRDATSNVAHSATDMLVTYIVSIIPFSHLLGLHAITPVKEIAAEQTDAALNSEAGKEIAQTTNSWWERALLYIGEKFNNPMPTLAASLQEDQEKITKGLEPLAASIKKQDGTPLLSAEELQQAVNLGVKDSITLTGLMFKPTPQDIAENIHKETFNLTYSKLLETIPESDRTDPTKTMELKQEALQIAAAVSGVQVQAVDENNKIKYKDISVQGSALTYLASIYPTDGQTPSPETAIAFAPPAIPAATPELSPEDKAKAAADQNVAGKDKTTPVTGGEDASVADASTPNAPARKPDSEAKQKT